MTRKDFFASITAGTIVTPEMAEKAAAMLAQLDKEASRERKVSPKEAAEKAAREALAVELAHHLSTDPMTAAAAAKLGIDGIATTSKATSLLKLLVDTGRAEASEVRTGSRIVKGYALVHTDL